VNPAARDFLIRWGLISLGVFVASYIVPGMSVNSIPGLFVAALLLGLLNAFVRPLITLLSLPLVIVTFGLFLWVINAALLYFVGWLVRPSFQVASFWSALGGAAVISLVSWAVSALLGLKREPNPPRASGRRTTDHRRPPPGSGPVIDV
jgi:putative membrane protein